ncbi:hypothetical protein HJFPF1_09849 [Paramyrothecium foliicola]|nr:hypothetical protein HJFPF1_09849 [Paramyrothecium foliicola]
MHSKLSLLSFAFAINGAIAAPNAPLTERQNEGYFMIQYFTEPNCQGTMIDGSYLLMVEIKHAAFATALLTLAGGLE